MIVRFIKPDDMDQIAGIYKESALEVPIITDTTLVAVEDGKIHAVFSARQECHVEWVCRENYKGWRAGLEVFTAGENMLKAQGVAGYEVGVLRGSTNTREIVEKLGFETWGQLLYEKKLNGIIY